MTSKSLNRVLAAIENGRSQNVLARLASLHYKHFRDTTICFVYAHALEQAGQADRAATVWKFASKLQGSEARNGDLPQPTGAPGTPFRYTPSLGKELDAIFATEDLAPSIQKLSDTLNALPPAPPLRTGKDWPNDPQPDEEELTVVSETLGRILITQSKYGPAALVYRALAEDHPDRKEDLLAEADRLQRMALEKSVS